MLSRIVIRRQMLQDGLRKSTHLIAKFVTGSRKPRTVGEVSFADEADEYGPTVNWITVIPGWQRRGIGTKLYEAAARDACEIYGLPLTSDAIRSEYSQRFWEKQVEKGRASCLKECPREKPDCRPSETVFGRGRCTRYRMISCPAPSRLDGAPRRRRRP